MAEGDTSQTDADGDGLTRDDEITYGSNPDDSDTDDDGLDDSAEIALNTCPWKIDSDSDGIPDNTDSEPLKPNNCVWFGASDTRPQLWWIDSPSKPNYGITSNKYNYVYDSAGNLKTKTENGNIVTKYYYNAQNKLVRIEGDGFLYEFLYDSQNRRTALSQNGTWRKIIHDGNLPIIETDCTNLINKIFVRGLGIAEGTGDVIAETDESGDVYFYLANHRGDTIVVLDDDGDLENYLCYDAFGNIVDQTGTFEPRYTFSTKEFLSDAELYLYAYRVYDSISGRWTQRDPIDYDDSVNLYQFCGNNSVNGWDALGLKIGDKFDTVDDAAKDAINEINPKSQKKDKEMGGWIVEVKDVFGLVDGYKADKPKTGRKHGLSLTTKPQGCSGIYHAHGAESGPNYNDENFSASDENAAKNNKVPIYVGTPSNSIKKYDPATGKAGKTTELQKPTKKPLP